MFDKFYTRFTELLDASESEIDNTNNEPRGDKAKGGHRVPQREICGAAI